LPDAPATLLDPELPPEADRAVTVDAMRQSLGLEPLATALAAVHPPFTGRHTHSHTTMAKQPSTGEPAVETSHSHSHLHSGDARHDHAHGASAENSSPFARLSESERRRRDGANEITDPDELAALVASAWDARGGREAWEALRNGKGLTASVAADGTVTPAPWHCYACAEGIRTDDGRELMVGSTNYPDMPISIRLLIEDEGGHWGAVTCGRVDTCEGVIAQALNFTYSEGMFGSDPNGQLAELMVAEQTQRFISIDPRDMEGEWITVAIYTGDGDYDDECLIDEWFRVSSFTLGAMTIVSMPALQMCCITLKDVALPDSPIAIQSAPPSLPAPALLAAGGPPRPQRAWFDDPGFHVGDPRLVLQTDGRSYACPLTITLDGQVYGHVAWWECEHTGFQGQKVKPPRSKTNYANYLTGPGVVCDDGTIVEGVGQLTAGCGHAPTSYNYLEAIGHYDGDHHSAFQWADVRCGQDDFGPWVAGALRADLTEAQVREVRALSLSGDWRKIGGNLELVAVLAVPVPGFPIRRALVASGSAEVLDLMACRQGIRGQEVWSLVAAGRVVARTDAQRIERLEREMAVMAENWRALSIERLRASL
jgi:hypothetical protein